MRKVCDKASAGGECAAEFLTAELSKNCGVSHSIIRMWRATVHEQGAMRARRGRSENEKTANFTMNAAEKNFEEIFEAVNCGVSASASRLEFATAILRSLASFQELRGGRRGYSSSSSGR
jgi:hypothetical protein